MGMEWHRTTTRVREVDAHIDALLPRAAAGHAFVDDDCTVTVVDLVPSGEPIVPKDAACCLII